MVADSATVDALDRGARDGSPPARREQSFPILRAVAPAENVAGPGAAPARRRGAAAIRRCFSGTLDRPVLTGPSEIDEHRRPAHAADRRRGAPRRPRSNGRVPRRRRSPLERVVTEQAAGNLQMIRRGARARARRALIFIVTLLLATLLLSNLVEEKSNKVIEVLAAAVPLDAVFLGKLHRHARHLAGRPVAVGRDARRSAYLFFAGRPGLGDPARVAPAVGWPVFVVLLLLYYARQLHAARRALPRHRRPGEQHPRDPDPLDAGHHAAGAASSCSR